MQKLLFLFLLNYALCVNAQDSDTLNWRENYKLQWEDFQGTPDTINSFAAISAIQVYPSLDYNGKSVKVYCFFEKKRSWSKNKSDKILLAHEIGHFNIAEIFARKLRRAFQDYINVNGFITIEIINKYFYNFYSEQTSLDELYDKETEYSRDIAKQKLWNLKIIKELYSLKKYKN